MPNFLFRTTPTRAASTPRLDRANNMLYDVCAMQSGVEALGHGCTADQKTLMQMAALGNAKPGGVRGRFGHPGMSENATGKQVQLASNFRVEGDRLLHDSHLLDSSRKSPAFAQDPVEFIFAIAENYPTEFAESAVVNADLVWTLPDGRELPCDENGDPMTDWPRDVQRDPNGKPTMRQTAWPVLRPTNFFALDFVNEGALTHDGLFSARMFDGHSAAYAQQLFQLVDEWRAAYKIPLAALPDKVNGMLAKYIAARDTKGADMKRKTAAALNTTNAALSAAKYDQEPVGEALELEPLEDDTVELATDDPTETALDSAERIMSALPGVVETASPVTELRLQVQSLTEQVTRLSSLVAQQAGAIETMFRNFKRIDGEPVVTQRVPKQQAMPLESPFEYAQPRPAASFAMQTPVHVSQRAEHGNLSETTPAQPPANPLAAAAAAQLARNQRVAGGVK